MKKKIIAICLCVALVAVGIVGATLAYFTDSDQVENTFSVGNVDIDLYEKTDYNGDGKLEEKEFQEYLNYSDIMPGDELPKEAHIRNVSKTNKAYVRVAVVMNHVSAINDAIDGVYEDKGYTDDQIQDVYDEVFDGWGVNYTKRTDNSRRMWMDSRVGENSPVLFNIDTYAQLPSDAYEYYGMYDIKNEFLSETEEWRNEVQPDGFIYGDDEVSYYSCIDNDERIYVFYLELDPEEDYTLFDGLNVPEDFTGDQLKMFDGLKIGIYADAIQTENFADATAAFEALEAAHPLGWWNTTKTAD